MADLSRHIAAELENIHASAAQIPSKVNLRAFSKLELIGVATIVSNFYHGVENILKQILLFKEIRIPSDERWHKRLLEASLQEGIIQQKTRDHLLKFLAFRHFYTHAYSIDVDPEKLAILVASLNRALKAFELDLYNSGYYHPSP